MPASNQPPAPRVGAPDLLDHPLLFLSDSDIFTVRDACQGVQVFGETGSGKTSGSGRYFAEAYLRAGMGGLVLAAKTDELDLWRQYAADTGRSRDLIVFGEDSPHRFNILQYEYANGVGGLGLTRNLLEFFLNLHDITSGKGGRSGADDDPFWRNEVQKLIINSLDALRLADEEISLSNVSRMVRSAPRSVEDFASDDWREKSFCYCTNAKVQAKVKAGKLTPAETQDWNPTYDYWRSEFPDMPDRTRGNVVGSFTGMLDLFARGSLRELLCTTTTVTPEDSMNGKIIFLNLPLKRCHEVGIYTQSIFKYCWQRAVERRKIFFNSRPVFLWADESQLFINQRDTPFQTTARGARACTVLLTQNLPNYYAKFGGDSRGESLTKSLLGNLTTKIFHNNGCAVTNKYASELFAQTWRADLGQTTSERDGKIHFQEQTNKRLTDQVIPHEFTVLANGGMRNDLQVEAIVYQGGRIFTTTGMNGIKVAFAQKKLR